MNATHNLKKIVIGALLSGGVAAAGLGLSTGTAIAQPQGPGVGVDYSDVGPLVTCNACQVLKPGDGSVKIRVPQFKQAPSFNPTGGVNPVEAPSVAAPSAGR